ncbi:hypothetical protein BGX38DRAFT_1222487 [Terfezia claveryi]|nr:hypothetical protein BGX38DRAFT_1222487 [Terfezia claveryi]
MTFHENLERSLTCPICLGLFSTTPLTLNCLHNYCSACMLEFFRALDFSSPEFEEDLTQPVPVCPTCRAPIYSVKPNPLLGNILSDYFAEYPEKLNPDIHYVDSSKATAVCNDILELYTRGMIIPTRGIDGLMVCMMQRVSQEQYERHRDERRGAGMIWISHGDPSNNTSPDSAYWPGNISLTSEETINDRSEHPENMSNLQLPESMIPYGPVTGGYNYTSTRESLEGDATGTPSPATVLHTDCSGSAEFFLMQRFDLWREGDESWSLEEVWGNWQTDGVFSVNDDGQWAFHLS